MLSAFYNLLLIQATYSYNNIGKLDHYDIDFKQFLEPNKTQPKIQLYVQDEQHEKIIYYIIDYFTKEINKVGFKYAKDDNFMVFTITLPKNYEPAIFSKSSSIELINYLNNIVMDNKHKAFYILMHTQSCIMVSSSYKRLHELCEKYEENKKVQNYTDLDYNVIGAINYLFRVTQKQNIKELFVYPTEIEFSATDDIYKLNFRFAIKTTNKIDSTLCSDIKDHIDEELKKSKSFMITQEMINRYITKKLGEITDDKSYEKIINAFDLIKKYQTANSTYKYMFNNSSREPQESLSEFNLSKFEKPYLCKLGFDDKDKNIHYNFIFDYDRFVHLAVMPSIDTMVKMVDHLKTIIKDIYVFYYRRYQICFQFVLTKMILHEFHVINHYINKNKNLCESIRKQFEQHLTFLIDSLDKSQVITKEIIEMYNDNKNCCCDIFEMNVKMESLDYDVRMKCEDLDGFLNDQKHKLHHNQNDDSMFYFSPTDTIILEEHMKKMTTLFENCKKLTKTINKQIQNEIATQNNIQNDNPKLCSFSLYFSYKLLLRNCIVMKNTKDYQAILIDQIFIVKSKKRDHKNDLNEMNKRQKF
ncbi:hypothetical protein BDAP_001944 [Binucleata daphniae]